MQNPSASATRREPTLSNWPSRCVRFAASCGVLLGFVTGCAHLPFQRHAGGIPKNAPCVLPKNPTVVQVVDHVNANVEKVHGWRSDGIKIRANNAPITLQGTLIVERDQRLRLEVRSPMGKEVDFGSNDEVFWIWSKRAGGPGHEPAPLLFAAHEDLDLARQQLPMPFEPPWLMEALGVAPLSSEGMQMETTPGVATIKLVSQHQLSDGRSVRKVVSVDSCHGRVLEHSIYDLNGQPLVRTVMGDHRIDRQTGALLPRYLKLDWPQAEMSLAMEFGMVEVNPTTVPAAVWQMPQIPDTPLYNLAAGQRRKPQPATVVARSRTDLVAPESIEAPSSDEPFELPHVNRSRPPVELEAPQFEEPELPGRARYSSWSEE